MAQEDTYEDNDSFTAQLVSHPPRITSNAPPPILPLRRMSSCILDYAPRSLYWPERHSGYAVLCPNSTRDPTGCGVEGAVGTNQTVAQSGQCGASGCGGRTNWTCDGRVWVGNNPRCPCA